MPARHWSDPERSPHHTEQLRSTKEGVGETSGQTAGSNLGIGVRASRRSGRRNGFFFVRCRSLEVCNFTGRYSGRWDLILTCSPTPSFQPQQAVAGVSNSQDTYSKTHFPKTDFPKTDFPKTDFPKTDFPKTDFPWTVCKPNPSGVRSRGDCGSPRGLSFAMVTSFPRAPGDAVVRLRDKVPVYRERAARAFTSRSSRSLNWPSSLVGHDRRLSRANRRGVLTV